MAFSNIHFESGRPYGTFKAISDQIGGRFNGPLNAVRVYKVSIILNRTSIIDVRSLAILVAKQHLEKDLRTLNLFFKAVKVIRNVAEEDHDKPYGYDLDLGKLLPAHLANHNLQGVADTLLKTIDLRAALEILRNMGVVKRDYDNLIDAFKAKSAFGWTEDNVNKLVKIGFEILIRNAEREPTIQLNFGRSTVTKPEDLAEKVFEKHLEKDGRTLALFKKSISVTTAVARRNALKFILDLALLTPAYLRKIGVKEKEVEDMIDTSDHRKIVEFLYRISALEIEPLNANKRESSRFLFRVAPDLLYPE